MDTKKLAFEYYVIKLHEWYKEALPENPSNDLSVLKVLKLLFFGVALNSEKEQSLLEDPFNKFCAMPYGHVESEIYDIIKSNHDFQYIELLSRSSSLKVASLAGSTITNKYTSEIDNTIQKLKSKNFDLIKMTASDLVKLSHEWYSWKYYFNKAKLNGSFSELIPVEIIKLEQKFFYL